MCYHAKNAFVDFTAVKKEIMTKNEQRIKALFKVFRPYVLEILEEEANENILDADDAVELLEELQELLELFTDKKRDRDELEDEITDYLLEFHDVRVEDEIDDPILRRVVRSLKYDIVKRRERERLARGLTRIILDEVDEIPAKELAKFTGKKGIVQKLIDALEEGGDMWDEEFLKLSLDAAEEAALASADILTEKDFKKALELGVEILDKVEQRRSPGNELLEFANYFLARFEVMDAMRRAFTGLLLGDIMLMTLGAALGLKQRLSLSDFMVFVGVKVFETEILRKIPKADIKKIKAGLKKIK